LACPQPQKGAKGAAKRGIAMHTHAMKARAATTKNRGGGKTEEEKGGWGPNGWRGRSTHQADPLLMFFWPAALPGCIIIMQHAAVDMECLRFVAKTKRCLTPERVLASTSPISPHLGNGKGAGR